MQFSEWQLSNVQSFGLEFSLNSAFWISAVDLQDAFAKVPAAEVNPLAIGNEGSLGHSWYEWLADGVPNGHGNIEECFMEAARHFSWDFPQLKMVILDFRADKVWQDHFLDGAFFQVMFYS
jgi:hypothetical protein